MTRVCLIGDSECNLQYELLSRETSREALATYDLERPFENSLALRTVSVGAAVSLLNDLQWYLIRFVDEALVQEPSVSDDEWLSRPLAEALRNGDLEPEDTGEYCKIYGVQTEPAAATPASTTPTSTGATATPTSDPNTATSSADDEDGATDSSAGIETQERRGQGQDTGPGPGQRRLVEPLYVRRTNGELPTYDLRDVEETLVVRLTEAEYSP